MKKIGTILVIILLNISVANAKEVIHGIDIDEVYNNGDWSSKEYIKQLINDYTLFIELKKQLNECSTNQSDQANCIDTITQKILQNFYTDFTLNWNNYNEFKKISQKIYSVPYCSDKFSGAGGTMCEIDTKIHISSILNAYAETLLSSLNNIFSENYPFLQNYTSN